MDLPPTFDRGPMRAALLVSAALASATAASALPAQRTATIVKTLTLDANEQDFTRIPHIGVGDRGQLAVAQPADFRIILFDAAGKRLGTFGRSGAGPGELRSVGRTMGWSGDSLWFVDGALSRVTRVGPTGQLLGEAPVPKALTGPKGEPSTDGIVDLRVQARLPDGSWVATTEVIKPGTVSWLPTVTGDRMIVVRMTAEGRFLALLAREAREGQHPCQREVTGAVFVVPFCKGPVFTFSADASMFARVAPLGSGRFEISVTDARTGRRVSTTTHEVPEVPIPRQVADSIRRRMVSTPGLSRQLADAYASLEYATSYPVVDATLVGRDHTVWVEVHTDSKLIRRWHVLTPEGKAIGVVEVPRHVTIRSARRDQIWSTETDPDGLESVTRYSVRWPQ